MTQVKLVWSFGRVMSMSPVNCQFQNVKVTLLRVRSFIVVPIFFYRYLGIMRVRENIKMILSSIYVLSVSLVAITI